MLIGKGTGYGIGAGRQSETVTIVTGTAAGRGTVNENGIESGIASENGSGMIIVVAVAITLALVRVREIGTGSGSETVIGRDLEKETVTNETVPETAKENASVTENEKGLESGNVSETVTGTEDARDLEIRNEIMVTVTVNETVVAIPEIEHDPIHAVPLHDAAPDPPEPAHAPAAAPPACSTSTATSLQPADEADPRADGSDHRTGPNDLIVTSAHGISTDISPAPAVLEGCEKESGRKSGLGIRPEGEVGAAVGDSDVRAMLWHFCTG